jgi:NitT/TauT family transport system permease protein
MMAAGICKRAAKSRLVDTALLIMALFLLWQAFYEIAGATALTPPLETIAYSINLLQTAEFWGNVAFTFKAFALAALISIVGGLAIGALLGLKKVYGEAAEPALIALYTIPKVAFYPVIGLFLGIGLAAEVAFGVIHGLIPITIFTMNAVANIKPVLLRFGRSLGLNQRQLILTIAIPAAVPEIFTGLRVGFSLTFIGTLLSEMFGSRAGLGFMLMNAIGLNIVPLIMSVTFLILLFAAIVNTILLYIDQRLHQGAEISA